MPREQVYVDNPSRIDSSTQCHFLDKYSPALVIKSVTLILRVCFKINEYFDLIENRSDGESNK